jgi:hypothetical protein
VPVPVVAGDTAHLDAEDQADMLHGHLGQEALKTVPAVGPTTGQALIVVDDQDAIPGPAQGDRVVGEGILALPRLAMIEDLLRVGLADVDDGESIELKIEDLGRSQGGGPAGAGRSSILGRARGYPRGLVRRAHDRPPSRCEALAVAARGRD